MKHIHKSTARDGEAARHDCEFKTSLIYIAEKRRESSSGRRGEKGEVGRRKGKREEKLEEEEKEEEGKVK